ncbi:hypothetical protein CAPNMURICA_47 [Arthrobacter phage CapnMurica]|uniref:Uncharacterized protein n=2 Tax=Gordonvirus captnmurica TaxID=1982153 RepID=A0A386KPV1_9CAUD|nr:hypothetical protein FDH68_gp47 [Arthrobacter phage CaptnMurica]ALY08647.1 hypothetical protein CAPNMURICA_47 [Arthrobacter phage CaptnMurica]AYD87260.1 hypothetical protein SEA_TENNO_50 [Arthrobacter phage Tenno]
MSEEKGKTMNYGKVSSVSEDKEVPTDHVPAEKVISGVVIERKAGLGSKIRETFMGVSAREVGQHVVMDVLLPQLKGMAVDAGTQALERLILGEARRTTSSASSSRVRGSSYTAYNRFSGGSQASESEATNFRSNRVREVIVETRGDAQMVLDRLFEHIDRYNAVSVSYYYELVGITGTFTDHQWGWTNLNASGVSSVREGYRIELPAPISIK